MEYKQVIVLRKDLKWNKGKMAAHAAHAALHSFILADKKTSEEWLSTGAKKVVLKVKDLPELKKIYQNAKKMKLPCTIVTDAGKTQLERGEVTAVGIGPAPEKDVDKVTGKLKLL